jgi:glutathione S-transferase
MADLHQLRAAQDVQPVAVPPEHGELAKGAAKAKIGERFAFLEWHLEAAPHFMGERFSAADAYAFTIVGWSRVGCALGDAGHGIQRRPANREANSNDSNL